jgi:predicted DNA-binding transcriptional regulator YafY
MSDAIFRNWVMLKHIPRYPRKITASELCALMRDEGYETSKRTIERDLQKLSGIFALTCDEREKPYGWSWEKNAMLHDLPSMDAPTALTFKLVEQFLSRMMPPSATRHLEQHFRLANSVLESLGSNHYKDWSEKVRIVPRTQPLLPAAVSQEVVTVVYDALLNDRRFTVNYRTGAGEEKEYEVNPLGIVLRDNVIYLVATLWDYQDIKQLALHRMVEVSPLDKEVTDIPGFDLQGYINSAAFHIPDEGKPTIHLKVRFNAAAAAHLRETPLSEDQRLTEEEDGDVLVSATVANTQQLRWWLLGLGDNVEVVSPKALRQEMHETIASMLNNYAE